MEITEPYKLYLPNDLINTNYDYSILQNYIQVKTNQNCRTQYTSTYCDCFNIYHHDNYVTSEIYECNITQYVNIDRDILTSDTWQSPYLYQSMVSIIPIFLLIYATFRFTILQFRKALR